MTTESSSLSAMDTECSSSSDYDDYNMRLQAVIIMDKTIITSISSHVQDARDWVVNVEYNHANPLRLIVGIDIKLGAPPDRPVALLSLCVSRTCFIYELTYAIKISKSLSRFLSDRENNTFVGIGIESKLLQLQQECDLGGRMRWVDLGKLTAERYNRAELSNAGHSELRTFLHGSDVNRPWPPVIGNWDAKDLSSEHVRHACIDAFTCYELGSFLVFPIKRGTPD